MEEQATIQHIESYLRVERERRALLGLMVYLIPIAGTILVLAVWGGNHAAKRRTQ